MLMMAVKDGYAIAFPFAIRPPSHPSVGHPPRSRLLCMEPVTAPKIVPPPPIVPPRTISRFFTLRVIGATIALVGAFTLSFAWLECWSVAIEPCGKCLKDVR